jgi:hypothetical protein
MAERPVATYSIVADNLAAELRDRLVGLGYDGELADTLSRWAGSENLEERGDGTSESAPSCSTQ